MLTKMRRLDGILETQWTCGLMNSEKVDGGTGEADVLQSHGNYRVQTRLSIARLTVTDLNV